MAKFWVERKQGQMGFEQCCEGRGRRVVVA